MFVPLVMPKMLAHRYIRWSGKADFYYEELKTYWGLKKLTQHFDRTDYTIKIIQDPKKFAADYMLIPNSLKYHLANMIARYCYFLVPTYIWILKKS